MSERQPQRFRHIHAIFPIGHLVISLLFVVCALALILLSCYQLWLAVHPGDVPLALRLNDVLESLALLTVAVAALELGETILEEQVQRAAHMSAPTRVRRFLSRFMVVLVVALSIETLVLVFRFGHDDPQFIPFAAATALGAAALLASWGVFVRMNVSAEALEPEAMEQAKMEDRKIDR